MSNLLETEPADSWDWRSQYKRLAVDGHIEYHTEIIMPVELEKCKHLYRIKDINSGGQVPPYHKKSYQLSYARMRIHMFMYQYMARGISCTWTLRNNLIHE
jgi:hypothetical protein